MTHHTAPNTAASNAPITASARRLLDGGSAASADLSIDVDTQLLETAAIVFAQLQMIRECSLTDRTSGAIVVEVYERAESLHVCSTAAIGVVGVLVGEMRSVSEARLACVLATAHESFEDEELIRGAVALLAATTACLADTIGAAPIRLHDELHGRPRHRRAARGRCARRSLTCA